MTCLELQWWFVVPRVGDEFGGAWYDRRTGEITRVQVPATPIVDTGTAMARLPWRTSRAAIDAIAEAILNGGTAITAMSMPQLSE